MGVAAIRPKMHHAEMSRGKNGAPKADSRNGALLLCLGLIIIHGFCGVIVLIGYGLAARSLLAVVLGVLLLAVTIAVFVLFRRLGGEVTPQRRSHAASLPHPAA